VFDRDRTGFMSKAELVRILMNFCHMEEGEAERLIEQSEMRQADDQVMYEAFVQSLFTK
jgi:Ca2+-binding EF-hand superfamily protein